MITRSVFTGAIRAFETVTQTFPIERQWKNGPFTVRVPEGALVLAAHHWITVAGDNALYDGAIGAPTTDGLGWTVQVPNGWKPGDGDWKADVSITVAYAVPA